MAQQETQTFQFSDRVKRALKAVEAKPEDLDTTQINRAAAAEERKPGLSGKALGTWIMEGKDGPTQQQEAKAENAKKAAGEAAAARDKAATERKSAYPDEIRQAVKLANEIRGKGHGPGPKQHVHVREVAVKFARENKALTGSEKPNRTTIQAVSGLTIKQLEAVADGSGPKDQLKALRPLASAMGDDQFCKGRNLAAILAAWSRQMGK